jgi:hypothetical protein
MTNQIRVIGPIDEPEKEDVSVFVNTLCRCLDYLASEAEVQGVASIATRLRQESLSIERYVEQSGTMVAR